MVSGEYMALKGYTNPGMIGLNTTTKSFMINPAEEKNGGFQKFSPYDNICVMNNSDGTIKVSLNGSDSKNFIIPPGGSISVTNELFEWVIIEIIKGLVIYPDEIYVIIQKTIEKRVVQKNGRNILEEILFL